MTRCQFDPRPELQGAWTSLHASEAKLVELEQERWELKCKVTLNADAIKAARLEVGFFRSEILRLERALVQYLKQLKRNLSSS